MQIVLVQKSITDVPVDAVVNAADVSLKMNGGVSAVIKKKGGKDIEDEALEAAPLEIGQAIATSAGKLDAKFVIHAAAIKPGVAATEEHVRKAVKSALELADSLECESIALPAIGAGAGGFPKPDSARVILQEVTRFSAESLKTVLLAVPGDSFGVFEYQAKQLNVATISFAAFEKELDSQAKAAEEARASRVDDESDVVQKPVLEEPVYEDQKTDENDS